MRNLFIKQKYLNFILDKTKTIESRLGFNFVKSIKAGEKIKLNNKYIILIKKVFVYPTYEEGFKEHDFKKVLPDAENIDFALKLIEKFYPVWKQKKLGVYFLEIELV